ncbi:cation-translocating P-type ATPase [Candidatus Woesearchaeota archaeon]|jgi:P-type Ca2+ transporter type 2C|nr:cation-translocating P-type ATPase [Candidatus Woesearchaeota archaeon]MBT7238108.1 cation-translocating P-type ATPase [Candidatus Woesearchaeota archaeon]
MIHFHAKTRNQTVNILNTNPKTGLKLEEASYRLKKHGKNKIIHEKKISKFKIFLTQFKNPLVYILLAAILISLIIKEYIDALVILAIVVLNSGLGYYQEYKAERALELLKKIAAPTARVLRNKKVRIIPAENVVPGDILIIESGDKIPADARLLKITNLKINEATLTGESQPILKSINTINETSIIADQKNMIFAGTIASYGRALAVVTATGNKTQFGRIAFSLKEIKQKETSLQRKLSLFAKKLQKAILGIIILLTILGFVRGIPLTQSIMTAISLAVAAIPEGLPAVVTISLALGVQVMVKNKALIRKLSAIETLGAVTTICSDKTGTMTTGEMTVTQIYSNNELIHVTGKGYETKGLFKTISSKYDPLRLKKLMETAILCNNSQLQTKTGDPTELALLVAAKKANIKTEFLRTKEIPFDSEHKYMMTIDMHKNKKQLHMKGAPEVVIKKCKYIFNDGRLKVLTEKDKEKIILMNNRMASAALRVIALAYSKDEKEENLIFLGLTGMIDPARTEAKTAVKICKKAGIRVIMITGDNAITAQAVAKELNIRDKVLTGEQLEKLSKSQLKHAVRKIDIYARVNPEHKVKILEALQENGEIVAMTGDGINDAPALKRSDVGVAMGITGTDVSKESADMILLDDNFNSIVQAIKHGRRIFDNIKKFVKLLLSANFGEIGIIFASLLVGLPLPLLPLQILWINLITDSLPAVALGVDPAEKDIMKRKPRDPKQGILHSNMTFLILSGIILTVIGLSLFVPNLENLEKARTMTVMGMIIFELLLVFVCRSRTKTIFQNEIFSNKLLIISVITALALQVLVLYTPMAGLFKLTPLMLNEWIPVLGYSLAGITILEIRKLFLKQ